MIRIGNHGKLHIRTLQGKARIFMWQSKTVVLPARHQYITLWNRHVLQTQQTVTVNVITLLFGIGEFSHLSKEQTLRCR